ncbi:MAG: hypothetical protein H0V46_06220 [Sphingomonas sp.]|nr:hypothetical protein [Sphingomonas sp.]
MVVRYAACFVVLVATSALAHGQASGEAKILFASDPPLRLIINAPLRSIAGGPRDRGSAHAGTLSNGAETLPVRVAPRGLTRRKHETCDFPPLRVTFDQKPTATSVFAGQKSLKLVTHCKSESRFQRHTLLEYATYRLYNVLSPASFRARLAYIDYRDNGRPFVSRVGFFIEDVDDVAKRNGMKEVNAGPRLPLQAVDTAAAARVALFEYMVSNLDWSISAGPGGDNCCHNVKPISRSGAAVAYIPVPYDFDYSGLVNAPYAVPPNGFPDGPVTRRIYRGYCAHNAQALAAAALFRAQRGPMLAALAAVPGLESGSKDKAANYLRSFFDQIASDQSVNDRILKRCVG